MPTMGKKISIGRELASARRSLRALDRSLARLAAQVRDISRNNSAMPYGKPAASPGSLQPGSKRSGSTAGISAT